MEEETKPITCPCCNCEIKWIKQFPLAEITSFEYMPLPKLIRGPIEDTLPLQIRKKGLFRSKVIANPKVSEDVLQRLAQSEEFSYQGRIYRKVNFCCNEAYAKEDFFEYNSDSSKEDFEGSVGSLKFEPGVRLYADLTDDVKRFLWKKEGTLKTLEGFLGKTMPTKDIFRLLQINNRFPTNLREFSFSIEESNLGTCVLEVNSARRKADIHYGAGPGAYMIGFQLGVAKFAYNGLFREK